MSLDKAWVLDLESGTPLRNIFFSFPLSFLRSSLVRVLGTSFRGERISAAAAARSACFYPYFFECTKDSAHSWWSFFKAAKTWEDKSYNNSYHQNIKLFSDSHDSLMSSVLLWRNDGSGWIIIMHTSKSRKNGRIFSAKKGKNSISKCAAYAHHGLF